MKDNNPNTPALSAASEETPQFKGYTMEELRYQRALMALRKEFTKQRLVNTIHDLRPKKDNESKQKNSKFALAGAIASKVFSNLNALDYVMLGISLFGTAKKGYRLLRGKK